MHPYTVSTPRPDADSNHPISRQGQFSRSSGPSNGVRLEPLHQHSTNGVHLSVIRTTQVWQNRHKPWPLNSQIQWGICYVASVQLKRAIPSRNWYYSLSRHQAGLPYVLAVCILVLRTQVFIWEHNYKSIQTCTFTNHPSYNCLGDTDRCTRPYLTVCDFYVDVQVQYWVVTEVCREADLTKRVSLVKKFIKIAG